VERWVDDASVELDAGATGLTRWWVWCSSVRLPLGDEVYDDVV